MSYLSNKIIITDNHGYILSKKQRIERIIDLNDQGYGINRIAESVNVNRQTVSEILIDYELSTDTPRRELDFYKRWGL